MRIYRYEKATVYITEPTEAHLKKIRKATEIFLQRVVKERVQNGKDRKNNRRTSIHNTNARKRA